MSFGIIIVSIISLIVALFWIEYVFKVHGALGICITIVVLLLYILSSNAFNKFKYLETVASKELAKVGNRVSFITLAYSVTSTWSSNASDYYDIFPENVSQIKLFWFTFLAIGIPTGYSAAIAILIGNAGVANEFWDQVYNEQSLGGLINFVFERWCKFGKFLLVILWLSLITNNIMNNYSFALSCQMLDKLTYRYFSRWFIVIIIFAITLFAHWSVRTILVKFHQISYQC